MQDTAKHTNSSATPISSTAHAAASLELHINGKAYFYDGDANMPLLWFLRDVLRLTGTKYGCGIGMCGACTVLLDGKAARACLTPLKALGGQAITTIEGLEAEQLHAVQQAWIEEDVPQCGYCQSGQILAAVDLLKHNAQPNDADIAAIGNLCRCGTYPRIRRAIKRAAALIQEAQK